MVNYNNGKIYKIEPICEHDEGDIYIGATTKEYLSQRMETHRGGYRQWLKNKSIHSVTSYQLFEKYGLANCRIVLMEKVNASTKDELASKEAHYIQTTPCINKCIPGALHSIGSQEYQKRYRVNNRETLCAKVNAKHVCDCGGRYTHGNRIQHSKSNRHQKYIKLQDYCDFYWEDGSPCTQEDYEQSIL